MQLITILGQTSCGKSELAVDLAKYLIPKNHKVCIVGCDSRQVYKGLDIGTGKVEGKWIFDTEMGLEIFVYKKVSHFMIDFVEPSQSYNLQNFTSDFFHLMNKINPYFDTVILVGGSGLYAKTIVEKVDLGIVKTKFETQYNEQKLSLQKLKVEELQHLIKLANIKLNNSDYNNSTRLVSRLLKQKSIANNWLTKSQYYNFEKQYLYAILIDQNILKSKIGTRLKDRFNSGLIQEIDKYKYLGEQKFMALGLEYRQTWLYMNSKISLDQLQTNLLNQNLQYAKRQLTWLKNQKNLNWIKNLEQLIQDLDLG